MTEDKAKIERLEAELQLFKKGAQLSAIAEVGMIQQLTRELQEARQQIEQMRTHVKGCPVCASCPSREPASNQFQE